MPMKLTGYDRQLFDRSFGSMAPHQVIRYLGCVEIPPQFETRFRCAKIVPKNSRTGLSETGRESQSLNRLEVHVAKRSADHDRYRNLMCFVPLSPIIGQTVHL